MAWLFSKKSDDADVLELLLIRRGSHALIETRGKDLPAKIAKKISAMTAYLHQALRDDVMLSRYAGIETIRVEKLTYAVHVGPLAILISAIAGKRIQAATTRLRNHLAHLHATRPGELMDDAQTAGEKLLDQAWPITAT
jgi:hypothetical protein